MALGCGCSCQTLVPRYSRPDGSVVYPSVDANGVFTIPDPTYQEPWQGVGGDGVVVTDGGPDGHQPTISVCVNPDSVVPLEFVNVGGRQCLTAGLPDLPDETVWESPNIVVADGVRVVPGGAAGHAPSFQVVFGPGQPFGFDDDGRVVFTGDLSGFTCADLAGCSISALADVILTDPVEGDVLVFDANGQLVNMALSAVVDAAVAAAVPAAVEAEVAAEVPSVVAEVLSGGAATSVPAPPATGGPYTLVWDADGAVFAWV